MTFTLFLRNVFLCMSLCLYVCVFVCLCVCVRSLPSCTSRYERQSLGDMFLTPQGMITRCHIAFTNENVTCVMPCHGTPPQQESHDLQKEWKGAQRVTSGVIKLAQTLALTSLVRNPNTSLRESYQFFFGKIRLLKNLSF